MTSKTERACQSEIAASIREMMEGAAAAGVVNEQTMREFDSLLVDAPMRSAEAREHCAQQRPK